MDWRGSDTAAEVTEYIVGTLSADDLGGSPGCGVEPSMEFLHGLSRSGDDSAGVGRDVREVDASSLRVEGVLLLCGRADGLTPPFVKLTREARDERLDNSAEVGGC